MKTLTITSTAFKGHLTFEYNEAGYLESYKCEAELSNGHQNWIFKNFPYHLNLVDEVRAATKSATFTLTEREITFLMFWDRYNDKDRSSKKKTMAAWNKLSRAEQIKAYLYIPIYLKNKGETPKKYATTYLSDELWNN